MGTTHLREVVLTCVQKVKQYLLYSGRTSDKAIGPNPYGDVSKVFDIEAEDILTKCLIDELEDVVIVGEERGLRVYGLGRWVAIIDPIDGSTNFEADIPWSAISVAIGSNRSTTTRLSDVLIALVAEVLRDRIYIYENGKVEIIGASIKRRSIPKKIVLGYFDDIRSWRALKIYVENSEERKILRVLGSAALDILSVALGNAEIFIDIRDKLRNLDIVAALRIALALGAKAYVHNFKNPLDIPIDNVTKVSCIVGFSDEYLQKALDILNQIDLLDSAF